MVNNSNDPPHKNHGQSGIDASSLGISGEARLKSILKAAPVGIGITINRILIELNDYFCNMVGYNREDLIGKSARVLYPSDAEYEWVGTEKYKQIEKFGIGTVETKMVRKDGRLVDVLLSSSPINPDDLAEGVTFTALDITGRKKAEEELIRTRGLLLASIEQSDSGILIADAPDVKIRFANTAALGIRGKSQAPLTEIPVDKHPENWQVYYPDGTRFKGEDLPLSKAILKGERVKNAEAVIVNASGDERWVLANAAPVRDKEGKIIAGIVVFADISDRKRAEEMLRESEERLDLALKGANLGLWDWNIKTEQVVFNQRWAEMLGYDLAELEPNRKTWESLIHPEDIPVALKEFASHLEGETDFYRLEYRMRTKSGDWRWVLSLGKVMEWDKEGKASRASGVLLDITETRRLQELAKRAERLEAAGQIAGQVAHDFNNLLGPLMAFPEIIAEKLPAGSSARKMLDDMQLSANKIAEINQQLLTLGRRGYYNLEPQNLNEIAEHAVRHLGELPENIRIELKFDSELMPIMGGAAQLARAVMNLIANAIDAMGGEGTLRIGTSNVEYRNAVKDTKTEYSGGYVKLTVSDSGPGISSEVVDRIFEPFFTTKKGDSKRGSGLGLSVVHSVVSDHGGYIDCESNPGEGTSFHLYFPVTDHDIKQENQDVPRGSGEKILVVDDEFFQRKVMSILLSKAGYKVKSVTNGTEALELVNNERFDLVMIDIVIPEGPDGVEIYKRILQLSPDQKVIIMSGYSESEKIKQVREIGDAEYLRKPFTYEVLAKAVSDSLVGKKQFS